MTCQGAARCGAIRRVTARSGAELRQAARDAGGVPQRRRARSARPTGSGYMAAQIRLHVVVMGGFTLIMANTDDKTPESDKVAPHSMNWAFVLEENR